VTQLIEALQRGVHAFMPTAMDNVYVRIHALFSAGRRDEARALFERLLPMIAFSNQALDVSIRTFKHLRRLEGTFATDLCRAPTAPLDPFQQATLEHLAPRILALDAECAAARADLTQR
jgi:4-hydroxy-tetrahydrodipicolinate synthase